MDPGGDSAEREVNDKRRNRLGRCRESGQCSNNSTSQCFLLRTPLARACGFSKEAGLRPRHLTGSCSHTQCPFRPVLLHLNRCIGIGIQRCGEVQRGYGGSVGGAEVRWGARWFEVSRPEAGRGDGEGLEEKAEG